MTYDELVTAISEAGNQRPKALIKEILDDAADVIARTLSAGDEVSYRPLGKFKVTQRAGRTGRNPQDGTPVKILAKQVAKFKIGSDLAARVETGGKKAAAAAPKK